MDHLAPLIVVAGTGTGIGKTTCALALLRVWGRSARVCGFKPIETGVRGVEGADARKLRRASTFHVQPPARGVTYAPPLSPHLAARLAGTRIHTPAILAEVRRLRVAAEGVVLELAGGLFTPIAPGLLNVDLARLLDPTAVILVAPDRLGVLHDVGATTRAAAGAGVVITGILLSAPERRSDASTGRNAAELSLVTELPLLARLTSKGAAAAVPPGFVSALRTCLGPKPASRGRGTRGH